MNIFGIGNMELVVILLVALLVLGPSRMVDLARSLGRFWGEAQRTIRYAIDSATVEDDKPQQSTGTPAQEPVPGPEDAVARPSRRDAQEREDASPTEPGTNGHVHAVPPDSLVDEDGPKRG